MKINNIEFLKNSVSNERLNEYNDLVNCENVDKRDLLILLHSIYDFLNIIKDKYKGNLFDYYLYITVYNFFSLFFKNDDYLKKQASSYKCSLKIVNSCCKDLIKYIEKIYPDINTIDTSILYLIFSILINNYEINNSFFNEIITQFECNVKNINYISNSDININKVNNDNVKLKEITTCLKKTYKMN